MSSSGHRRRLGRRRALCRIDRPESRCTSGHSRRAAAVAPSPSDAFDLARVCRLPAAARRRSLYRDHRFAGAGQGCIARLARARPRARTRSRQHPRARRHHRLPPAPSHRSGAAPDRPLPSTRGSHVWLRARKGRRTSTWCRRHCTIAPAARYVVFLHATSRADKLWPDVHWKKLIEHFSARGVHGGTALGQRRRVGAERGARCRRSGYARSVASQLAKARVDACARRAGLRRRHRARSPGRGAIRSDNCTLRGHRSPPGGRRSAPARVRAIWAASALYRRPAEVIAAAAELIAQRARLLMELARVLYTALGTAALPLLPLRLWWRGRAEPGYRLAIGERFGRYDATVIGAPLLWVHAVSVGETRAAFPLVQRLKVAYPRATILLTHMTATGRRNRTFAIRRRRRPGVAAVRRAVRRASLFRAFPSCCGFPAGDGAVAEHRRRTHVRSACRCSLSTRACRDVRHAGMRTSRH